MKIASKILNKILDWCSTCGACGQCAVGQLMAAPPEKEKESESPGPGSK